MEQENKTKKQTISIVIAAKNEEKMISNCLDAVKQWANEIIIIDNGSSDKTVDICKKYTRKIYSYDQKVLIPLLQNIGIQKATKDWVLILDADVIVPKEAATEIKKKIQQEQYDGYYLPHKTYIMGKFMDSPFWTFDILKLFRREMGSFAGKNAHESLTFTGKVGKIENPLLHYSHPSLELEIKKINLYSSQDAQILARGELGGLLKRKIKRVGLSSLFMLPICYFFYLFIYRNGYRDGIHGFIVDMNMAFYIFLEGAKAWELELRKYLSNHT
jgi:glycosyltransferase involved in cell wall biosynthesis